jgi:hypothetical protein
MSKPASSYNQTRSQLKSAEDFYNTTTVRIQKIQSHLANAPRGTRLQGKVCVITGVGSLKGIGYANCVQDVLQTAELFRSRASAIRYAHEGMFAPAVLER